MAAAVSHPYGIYEEEQTYFYEPSIYQQQQQYYEPYPIIHDNNTSNCWVQDMDMDMGMQMEMGGGCWEMGKETIIQPQFYGIDYFEPAEYVPLSPITPAGSPLQDPYLLQYQYAPQYQQFQYVQMSPHPSPPSLTTSPLLNEETEGEEEEEEEEDDKSVIPNCGNKELRGMGLYDDTPVSCPAKGLVLEQSFGLPEGIEDDDEDEDDEEY